MSEKFKYFSKESRDARRASRAKNNSQIRSALTKTAGSGDITTQNAGTKALSLVRSLLDSYRLPTLPRLSYSGLRKGRTAANSSKVEDGVITISASLKTFSNVGISFDIPIEIHGGKLQDPSVLVYNGAARVISQATFDDLVNNNTIKDIVPVRKLYDAPLDNKQAKELYSNRTKMTRVNRGMFSLGAAKEELRKAIRGQDVDISKIDKEAYSDYVEPEQSAPEYELRGSRCPRCNKIECECSAEEKKRDTEFNPEIECTTKKLADTDPFEFDPQNPSLGDRNWGGEVGDPLQQARRRLQTETPEETKLRLEQESGQYPIPNIPPPSTEDGEFDDTVIKGPPSAVTKIDRPMVATKLDPKKAPKPPKPVGVAPKFPKNVPGKVKPPPMQRTKGKPDYHRLCSKCSASPCVCQSRKKVKADIWRPITAQTTPPPPGGGDSGDIKPDVWQGHIDRPGYESVPLSRVHIGGTFILEGEYWRKFEMGIRRQKGRAPAQLRQIDPNTMVLAKIGDVLKKISQFIQDADQELIAKVNKEFEDLKKQGLQDVDCKLALRAKYSPSVCEAVFRKIAPDDK